MNDKTRILFTIPNFITAGSGRALLNIIERLNPEKFSPAVCVGIKGGDLDKEVEQLGIPLIEAPFTVPARPYSTFFFRAWKLSRMFRPYRFTLWHSFHYLDDYSEALIARLSGTKGWIYTKKNMGWTRRSWYLRSFLAKGIAAQNKDMMDRFFNNRFYRKKAYLIPRGVNSETYKPDTPKRLNLRKKYTIPENATVVGCAADIVPKKGFEFILQALSQINDVYFLNAGKVLDTEYKNSLDSLIIKLNINDRVIFLDRINDIPAFNAEIDIFALATNLWGEGCPVALLEAMSCGKACIGTDVAGTRDVIEHEKNGLIVPAENADALAEALDRLTKFPAIRDNLGKAARKRIEQNYRIEKEVAAHEQLYAEVLNSF